MISSGPSHPAARRRMALAASILFFIVAGAATAGSLFPPREKLAGFDRNLGKASSHLLTARQLAASGAPEAEIRAAAPLVRLRDGLAEIEVRLHRLDRELLERIEAIGMRVTHASFRYARVDGRLDLDLLDEIAALPEVATLHPNYGYVVWTGSVDNQADLSIRAFDARDTFGIDGSGVDVGIISDSFNNGLGGTESGGTCDCDTPGDSCANTVDGMANQGSGDLPPSIPLLDDGPGGLSDEGAAIGELIADLAPGSGFLFHSAANSLSDFAEGITELANCGSEVIVDDVLYFAEPMFQNGIIAAAAQDAVDADIPYFSAAGNSATFGIDDFYFDSDTGSDDMTLGDDLHDFLPGAGSSPAGTPQPFARVTIPDSPDGDCGPGDPGACCGLLAVLQWNEPFDGALGSGAGLGPGAFNDLDLLLFDAPSPAAGLLDASVSPQGCSFGNDPAGDPLEIIGSFRNTTGAALDTFLAIDHFCGDQDGVHLRVATFATGPCSLLDYDFEDGVVVSSHAVAPAGPGETPIFVDPQIYGHPAAAGVVAAGAIDYREIDSAGAFQDDPSVLDVEPFSSLGGDLPFYFDRIGAPLGPQIEGPPGLGPTAPETRFKPEITGPDGTNTTFFGIDVEPDGFPNFFGTSASAPHAAAVAALMQDLGNLTPHGLSQVLEQSAFELEHPGVDDLSGFGLIDALNSVGTTVPSSVDCFIDELELIGTPNTGTQTFRACNSLRVSGGDFSDVIGIADEIIFADGFESGDTSAWGPP